MFERLRDRRPSRDQEAQDAAVASAASLLARRQVRQPSQGRAAAGGPIETDAAKTTSTVAQQIDAVARNAPGVYGGANSEGQGGGAKHKRPDPSQTLIVGAGIQLKGEITNCETLIVEGHIEGSAKSGTLEIADGGAFAGEADIDMAVISGTFEGTLKVTDRLVIRAGGRASGNIRYAAIAIEAGGQIFGDIQVIEGKAAPSEKWASAESAPAESSPQGGPDDRVEIAS